jgi:DNA-binding MarR family transcriptional regulator
MSDILTDPLPCTGARARRLTRRLTSFYEQHLRAIGLKLGQYSLLMHLSEEPQSMTELAARLEMDRTTLTRSLGPLLDRAWVKTIAGADARQRLFALSEEGLLFRLQARQHWEQAQLALEAQLGRDFVSVLNLQLEHALERLKPILPGNN